MRDFYHAAASAEAAARGAGGPRRLQKADLANSELVTGSCGCMLARNAVRSSSRAIA